MKIRDSPSPSLANALRAQGSIGDRGKLVRVGLLVILLSLLAFLVPPNVEAQFAWQIDVVEAGTSPSGGTSLALDSGDRPHLAFVDASSGQVKYGHWDGNQWSMDSLAFQGWAFGMVSMELDVNNRPHISFFDVQSTKIIYAHFNGVSWRILPVDRSHSLGHSSLSIGPDGSLYVGYVWPNGDLRLARLAGASWSLETVDPDVVRAKYPSIAFGIGDAPQIAYYGNGVLLHAELVRHGWWIDTVDGDFSPQHVSLAINSSGAPRIAYRNDRDFDLRFAAWNGSVWNLEVIDQGNDVGWDARMVLDEGGRPHVSYYDRTLGILKYAHRVGGSWSVRTVDNEAVVGWWSSLAVDERGRPHVSYYSWTARSIRYAVGEFALGIRTWPARHLTSASATLVGEVTALGDAPEVRAFFEWRKVGAGWNRSQETVLKTPGFVEWEIGGLDPEREYEFRFVASGGGVLFQGEVHAFSTAPHPEAEPIISELQFVVLSIATVLGSLAAYLFVVQRRRRFNQEGDSDVPPKREGRWSRLSRRERRNN